MDPYQILGIGRDADEDRIKKAYREKAREYLQAGYDTDSPQMRELDAAYDAVMRARAGNDFFGGSQQGVGIYDQIRIAIDRRDYDLAQQLLDSVSGEVKSAQWYYLQGLVQQKRGWLNAAYENFRIAYESDPSNEEFAAAFNSFSNKRSGGYDTREAGSDSSCSACDICKTLICAKCICDACDGDGHFCCC